RQAKADISGSAAPNILIASLLRLIDPRDAAAGLRLRCPATRPSDGALRRSQSYELRRPAWIPRARLAAVLPMSRLHIERLVQLTRCTSSEMNPIRGSFQGSAGSRVARRSLSACPYALLEPGSCRVVRQLKRRKVAGKLKPALRN